ncbi:MAG TPA: YjgN family protein [Rhizomicrobium sp.]|nr:YjgN family protein [Rhizomicrobium sp.]
MDIRTDAAPPAPVIRHQFRFEGSGGEYFKIWIVNLALTIVTLGIFSAWAKVRNKRYFYGNTYVGDHNFDYHGLPLRILLGRLIAGGILLGYSATIHFMPAMTFIWALFFLFAIPWLVMSSLRFNARNSSYRNIRFNFTGTYGGAFGAYIGWPLLAAITLFTTYPLARRARDQYNVNNHTFGGKYFHAEIPGAAMYGIYVIALLMFLGLLMVAGLLYAVLHFQPLDPKNPATVVPLVLIFGGVYAFSMLFLTTFVGTKVFNLVARSTVLAERFQFESTMSPLYMTWLMFSNLLLTLATLGLFYPWAKVSVARYHAERLAVSGPADMDGFMSELVAGQGAIGEEIASFFDIDIGL